jgi:site-specific DNA-methyltransferase (adenine-specific)
MCKDSLITIQEQGALFQVLNPDNEYRTPNGTVPTDGGIGSGQTADSIKVLPPADVFETLASIKGTVTTTILDPWYNKGVGGYREDYHQWLKRVIDETAKISEHIFVWGFPEIVHQVLNYLPKDVDLVAWLTWYYKNCPSVIRGWRSAQLTCLHLAHAGAKLYPEHFLNEKQLELKKRGKLRYLPGPPSVIETSLLVGFVGKKEQTGHPAQKPIAAIEPLVKMTTQEGDLVLDPMCGSGTTAVVCAKLNRRAIVCDESEEWAEVTGKRIEQYASTI